MRRRRKSDTTDALFDTSVVDIIARSADRSTVLLCIVNDQGWSGSDQQLESLQRKVTSYIRYALGQLTTQYPDTADLPWRIVVRCQAGPPDPRTQFVLDELTLAVRDYGGDLTVELARNVGE